jgi:hypothetical protein
MISNRELSIRQVKRDMGMDPDIYLPPSETVVGNERLPGCKEVVPYVTWRTSKYGFIRCDRRKTKREFEDPAPFKVKTIRHPRKN